MPGDDGHDIPLRGPHCPALGARAVTCPDSFVAAWRIDPAEARDLAVKAITASFFRPADIETAALGPTELMQVPFWRIEWAADAHYVRIVGKIRAGRVSVPVPLPGRRSEQSVSLIIARRMFPFTPKLVGRASPQRGLVGMTMPRVTGWSALSVRIDELTPLERAAALAGEVVEPDVERDAAVEEAFYEAMGVATPTNSIVSSFKPSLRGAALVYVPFFVTRYRYEGHAKASANDRFWVLLSGRDGKVVGAHHPSALRSVARKLRNLITF